MSSLKPLMTRSSVNMPPIGYGIVNLWSVVDEPCSIEPRLISWFSICRANCNFLVLSLCAVKMAKQEVHRRTPDCIADLGIISFVSRLEIWRGVCYGVPCGAPASGARSDTAAAAEPMLGVDSEKKIPSSRFLAFSLSRLLAFSIILIRSAAAAQDDFLDGLPMRAGSCVGGRGHSQPCGRSDGPAASHAASRGCTARGRASAPPASHRAPL